MLAIKNIYGGLDLPQVGKVIAVQENLTYICQDDDSQRQNQAKTKSFDKMSQFGDEFSAEYAYAEKLLAKKQKQLKKLEREVLKARKEHGELLKKQQEIMDGYGVLHEMIDNLSKEDTFKFAAKFFIKEPVIKVNKSVKAVGDDKLDFSFTKMNFIAAATSAAVTSCVATAFYKYFF